MQLTAPIRSLQHGLRQMRRQLYYRIGNVPQIRPHVLRSDRRELYVPEGTTRSRDWNYPEVEDPSRRRSRLTSCVCTAEDLASPAFRYWCQQLRESWRLHRKLWEFCYICQVLYERDALKSGRRGLAFAVGREPLPALFAKMGCEIVATDLAAEDPRRQKWAKSAQWAVGLEKLNSRGICPPAEFQRRVSYRPADMNYIPEDLTGFDFVWSSCSFEHCGSLELGTQFIWNQMACLKPGGIAVHTTELNLSSDVKTRERGSTTLFRRQDIEKIVLGLRRQGHDVALLDFDLGDHPLDWHVDISPYTSDAHLRLAIRQWASTSVGLIMRKCSN